MRLAVLACVSLISLVTLHAAVPEGSIEDFIDREMPSSGVPGLAYAVVTDGELETVGVRGVVAVGGDAKVAPDTPFAIGSISKSFTALAVMQLVEAGSVELDAEVARYLEGFADGPGATITIRQLLSHTSGYSTLQGNASHAGDGGGEDELARAVEQAAGLTPAHEPGTHWAYSNLNYQVLGRVIEVVSGEDYATYVESKILEPIGMDHSFVADGEVHEAMATGHVPWFWTKRPVASKRTDRRTAPQGGVLASARDVGRYMQVMLNGEDDVLSASGKAEMLRPASEASPNYGLGWYVEPEQGAVWHTGATPGFETLAIMVPEERRGVVVLTNAISGVGFGDGTHLINGIAHRAVRLDYEGPNPRWTQKLLFVGLVLCPLGFLLSSVWAWRDREALRAKSGAFGTFSLWFPLLTTVAGAVVILALVPVLSGVPLGTLRRFQPDFVLVLLATAVTGPAWAAFRLGVAYTGRAEA